MCEYEEPHETYKGKKKQKIIKEKSFRVTNEFDSQQSQHKTYQAPIFLGSSWAQTISALG